MFNQDLFILNADTSQYEIGAVLSQIQKDQDVFVKYFSLRKSDLLFQERIVGLNQVH